MGRTIYFDIEAINLLEGVRCREDVHVIVCRDINSKEIFVYYDDYDDRREEKIWLTNEGEKDGDLEDGVSFLVDADVLIGQTIQAFDFLLLEKIFPFKWNFDYMGKTNKGQFLFSKVVDTNVMSCVLFPDRRPPGQAYTMGRGNMGGHGLEAHGIRMGRYKPPIADWSKFTDEILHRCIEDTAIGLDFYYYLLKEYIVQRKTPNRASGISIVSAYRCELQIAQAMGRQAWRGFAFDMDEAVARTVELDEKLDAIEALIRPYIPLKIKMKKLERPFNGCTHGSYNSPVLTLYKKDGSFLKKVTDRYPDARGYPEDCVDLKVGGPYTPITWKEIPLGNRPMMKELLHGYGWRGVNYSKADQQLIDDGRENELMPWSGKIDEDALKMWKQRGDVPKWAVDITKWYIMKSRRSQLSNRDDEEYFQKNRHWPTKNHIVGCRGLIGRAVHSEKGRRAQDWYRIYGKWPTNRNGEWRLPAEAFPCATNTFRMRHKVVVNIPSRGLYPLRDLFIASKGKKLVICDGSGLELRMLAHYMNDTVYQEVILNGEIHTYNQRMAGLDERDTAKTFIYAFLYGSGLKNLSNVTGLSITDIARVVSTFKRSLPALTNLIEQLEATGKKNGFLLAIDGRRGVIRKSGGKLLVHTILNILLQMTGSIVMKYGHCMAENQMRKESVALDERGYPTWVEFTHDEFGLEVLEGEVEEVAYYVDDWGVEEKKEYFDDKGRMFSAPIKIRETSNSIHVRRYYHRAGELMARNMTNAGRYLKMRCPIAGEYKIGNSWAECH